MARSSDNDVIARLKHAAQTQLAGDPMYVRALLLGGGLVGGGLLGAALMRAHAEEERRRAQMAAFGTGVATGLAGPHLFNAAKQFFMPNTSADALIAPLPKEPSDADADPHNQPMGMQ